MDTVEELSTAELDRDLDQARRAMEGGNLAGLYTALVACESNRLALPDWANEALAGVWWNYVDGSDRGRSWLRSWKSDRLHYERWEFYCYWKERLSELKTERTKVRRELKSADSEEKLARRLLRGTLLEKHLDEVGGWKRLLSVQEKILSAKFDEGKTTDGRIYTSVARTMTSLGYDRVGGEAIRKSCKKVMAELKREPGSQRYYGGRLSKLAARQRRDPAEHPRFGLLGYRPTASVSPSAGCAALPGLTRKAAGSPRDYRTEQEAMAAALLTTAEAAAQLQLSPRTLEGLRQRGGGPAYVEVSRRRIRYQVADLESWISSRRYTSTADSACQRHQRLYATRGRR